MKLDSKAVASRSPSQRYPGSGKKVSYPGPPPSPHKVLKPHTKEHSDLQVPSLVSCPPLPVLICYPFPPDNSSSDISEKASSRSPPPPPPRGGEAGGGGTSFKVGGCRTSCFHSIWREGKTVRDLLLAQSLSCSPGSPRPPGSLGPASSLGDRALPSAVLSHQARAKRRRHCQGCMRRGGAGGLAPVAAHAPPGPASRAAEAPGRPPLLPPASCCPHRQDSELAPELLT